MPFIYCRAMFYILCLFLMVPVLFKKKVSCTNGLFALRGLHKNPLRYFQGNIFMLSNSWKPQSWLAQYYSDQLGLGHELLNVINATFDYMDSSDRSKDTLISLFGQSQSPENKCILIFQGNTQFTPAFLANHGKAQFVKIIKFLSSTSRWDIFYLGSHTREMQVLSSTTDFVRVHSERPVAFLLSKTGRDLLVDSSEGMGKHETIENLFLQSSYAYSLHPMAINYFVSPLHQEEPVGRWQKEEIILYNAARNETKCMPRMTELKYGLTLCH